MNKTLIDNLMPLLIVLLITGNVSFFILYKEADTTANNMSKQIPKMIEDSYKAGCMQSVFNITGYPPAGYKEVCKYNASEFSEPIRKLMGSNGEN